MVSASLVALFLLPSICIAQSQDWAKIIEQGTVVHAKTTDTTTSSSGFSGPYARETTFNVLFKGKMWMCWQTYEQDIGTSSSGHHRFWCAESNVDR